MGFSIQAMVDACRVGAYAPMVGPTKSGWAVMADRQVLPGYCLLLPDPVVSHLNALPDEPRAVFLADMASLGDALISVTGAVRINYAVFGNVEPALHAHLFPRRSDEPEAIRTAQPWALDWQAAPVFDEVRHGELKHRLLKELRRRRVVR